jgi:hypothetical protein
MRQTLQQAVRREVALPKRDIALHTACVFEYAGQKEDGKRKLHRKQRGVQQGVEHSVALLRYDANFAAH